jgi:hypothetical protein
VAVPAGAAAPPQQIVDATTATLLDGGDEAPPSPAMFSQVDINGDGAPDWKVDYGAGANATLWCGTGGCTVELWASQPSGDWSKVMEELVRVFELKRTAGVTRMELGFHGSTCGGAGADDCERGYVWNEDTGWVPVANKAGVTWLYGGPVPLNLSDRMAIPADVYDAFVRLQAACPPGGGEAERQTWSADRIPDINGDGQDDWVAGGGYNSCAAGSPTIPLTVLVSGAGDSLTEAYSKPDATFGLDIATRPAAFYVIPMHTECGGEDGAMDRPCGTRLRWDAALGRLVE